MIPENEILRVMDGQYFSMAVSAGCVTAPQNVAP